MRTAADVLNRLVHDEAYVGKNFIVGYVDRFLALQKAPLSLFANRDVTEETFIPWHRVLFFAELLEDGKEAVIWHKKEKVDLVFHSVPSGFPVFAPGVPPPRQVNQEPCLFFGTKKGCNKGNKCKFSHTSPLGEVGLPA